ncbi:MAG: hypothetical protein M1820_001078 [Bogoriella megaspora]|nr:MAG: hypothetical protein M1820_001078 [Bogoriella megaspora]
MPQFYDSISDDLRDWALAQPLFFTASAPLTGSHINVSPKGMPAATLSVISPNLVGYVDATGSGAETISHIYENGRVTIMFCGFGKSPRIMRWFCRGRVVERETQREEFNDWMTKMGKSLDNLKSARAVILLDVFTCQTSCGYGVPFIGDGTPAGTKESMNGYTPYEDRPTLREWGAKTVKSQKLLGYQIEKNTSSLDGLPALKSARKANGQWLWLDDVEARSKRVTKQKEAFLSGALVVILCVAFSPVIPPPGLLPFDMSSPEADLMDGVVHASSLSVHQTTHEVTENTLPFPYEVRKQVYEHLLKSEHAKLDSKNGDAHTYHFHAAILSVSRHVHREARAILYGGNEFVLITHYDGTFEHHCRGFEVPIVSNHDLGFFSEHRLFAYFETPFDPSNHTLGCCEECSRPPKLETMLMLADDLPRLCLIRKSFAFVYGGNYRFVTSSRDESRMRSCVSDGPKDRYKIKLELRSNTAGPPPIEAQRKLLQPFAILHGSSNNISFGGEIDQTLATQLKQTVGQEVLWSYAVGWDFIQWGRSVKKFADYALKAKNDRVAKNLYTHICTIWGKTMIPCHGGSTYTTELCCDWRQALLALFFDVNFALGLIMLKRGDLQEAALFSQDMAGNALSSTHNEKIMLDRAMHFAGILAAESGGFREAFMILRQAEEDNPLDQNVKRDLDIAERYLCHKCPCEVHSKYSTGEGPAPLGLSFSNSSLSSMPVWNTPFKGSIPDGIVGWQDSQHNLKKKELKRLGLTVVPNPST